MTKPVQTIDVLLAEHDGRDGVVISREDAS